MTGSKETLKVHNPTGAMHATVSHAPRLDTLAGKTICEISNGLWEYDRVFPAVRELLQKRFPTARIIPYGDVVYRRPDVQDLEYVSKVVKEKACQAVITGMAA